MTFSKHKHHHNPIRRKPNRRCSPVQDRPPPPGEQPDHVRGRGLRTQQCARSPTTRTRQGPPPVQVTSSQCSTQKTLDPPATPTTGMNKTMDQPPRHPSRRKTHLHVLYGLLRKEVIQPHLPVRLPCYDFVPIADPTFDSSPHKGWATGFGCYRLS